MSVELRDDLNMRDLLDRCVQAELKAQVWAAQAKNYRAAVRTALRMKDLGKVKSELEKAMLECEGMEQVLW